jgi:hypothetical protein
MPGASMDVKLKVTDYWNKPVARCEVCLWAVDKSILDLIRYPKRASI